jgi:hypothetical protein
MPKLCGFQEDHESRTVVYVNPVLVRTVRPNASDKNKTVIEFDDNSTVAVFPPIKAVVDLLDEKWNE